jgi:peptidoglycan/LPS O-acetylase OafA/YrhL
MNAADRRSRLPFVDLLKAVAAQLIVLHHLAFYGPLSDSAAELLPQLIDWLSQHARIAVQVFLVVGGFLAARGLAPDGCLPARVKPLQIIGRRYWRLVLPYAVAMVLAVLGAALARHWMVHDSIPAAPHVAQFVAHLLLLHNLLDYEALSAGVWYVAIDFQLFTLFVLLLWLARRQPWLGMSAVAGLALASLFYFNLDSDWDVWALYFFGSYGLGALAWWLSCSGRLQWDGRTLAGVLLVLLGCLALAVEFRIRIAVALIVAFMLAQSRMTHVLENWPHQAEIGWLARISYSVFLVHFPVCLVVNAFFMRFLDPDPWMSLLGMGVAWGLSLVAGAAFYRWVEEGDWLRWQPWRMSKG